VSGVEPVGYRPVRDAGKSLADVKLLARCGVKGRCCVQSPRSPGVIGEPWPVAT
jgi:hypothetical protein